MKNKSKLILFFGAILTVFFGFIALLSGGASFESKEQRQRTKERLKKRKELNEKRSLDDLVLENDSDLKEFE